MAVWAVGDIQGCYKSFKQLLYKIKFNPKKDTLWIAGDLVNRGDGSLETLEYLYSIRESVKIILGNHDIALIGAYYGFKKSNPTIEPILQSADAKKLIDWLRSQKFLHVDSKLGFCMSHAGISPAFDLGMAIKYARKIENKLHGSHHKAWLEEMLKEDVEDFNETTSEIKIEKYILSSFIRMRYCDGQKLNFEQKGKPTDKLREQGFLPWFESKNRKEIELKIIFGHWSTLGYYQDENVLSLDTGCLWGGKLTVARLDTKEIEIISLACPKLQDF